MKKSGFSLIEIITVTAIMGIVMLIFSPMIDAFTGAQDRLYNQSKVDSRLNEVVEFIKRDVRNARSNPGGEPIEVFDNNTDNNLITDGSTGKKIIIHGVDFNGVSKDIEYYLDDTDLKLKVTTSSSIILSNVEEGEFKYKDKILLFYFKIDLPDRLEGKVRNEVRDVGVTRINLE
ncbi:MULTISPECIES: PulJ/GspJ family protein [Psychrilyobacter]|uniref:Prepilin-type N-terminal cleavage/methylation domain-containing protein n=1 Tax=Psychrilyobacter piezotolerans TaxID=2293438 RepID=A0ABX9KGU7_9FUSO|nr:MULTISPECIES: type II secretion system protein [Psychrilyobacter]MCS5420343.1 type II secretion system GspH family protein [Psychrilyobacter sp. S5]NDI78075.1 type II secretion system protein [Psychrilyobacter piezotolerans]RDE61666.1 type II secretion system protein [Psychrilyobacter sp. S5]REI41058.1 prepilin-type N-terminal cleavage/methylation domain-containing protein [Psychrilyobacter piezotolerans]